jgi:hypothetical protein
VAEVSNVSALWGLRLVLFSSVVLIVVIAALLIHELRRHGRAGSDSSQHASG